MEVSKLTPYYSTIQIQAVLLCEAEGKDGSHWSNRGETRVVVWSPKGLGVLTPLSAEDQISKVRATVEHESCTLLFFI